MGEPDLHFGDVIEFSFGDQRVVAMVVATKGDLVNTDEGTDALGDSGNILLLGLVGPEFAEDPDAPWHRAWETASMPYRSYKVLK